MSEDEAVSLARKGDSRGFEVLYAIHYPRILKFCRNKLRTKEDAEDVAQDIFFLVHRNINNYIGTAAFSTWLHRIANNAVVNHVRKQRATSEFEEGFEMAQNPTQHTLLEIKETLGRLSDMERFCVEAQTMGYSVKDLGGSSYYSSARKKLKGDVWPR